MSACRMLPGILVTVVLSLCSSAAASSGEARAGDAAENSPVSLSQARQAAEWRDQQRLMALLEDKKALESALADAREAHARVSREDTALRIEEGARALNGARLESRQSDQDDSLAGLLSALSRHGTEVRNELGDDSWLALGDTPLPLRLEDARVLEQRQLEDVVDSLAALTRATGLASAMTLPVVEADGAVRQHRIVRLGDFAAFTPKMLLARSGESDNPALEPDTPHEISRWLSDYVDGNNRTLAVDPTRGRVVEALTRSPSLWQRFHQGGYVGYIVVGLGLIGLLVAALQYAYLLTISARVHRQQRTLPTLRAHNPLGRVLRRFARMDGQQTPEALEARLDEAILAEIPRLERGQPLVKLLAAIAPLLGLLGTVTGMIVTFQAITVFGTGDPQRMAGGISQALVTTVLGLITAVPLLFAQTALSSRSRALTQIIEGQASAALATRIEADAPEEAAP
ncbi:MotA/TolQ/ExbB proton channel family protein [Vreelandella jeotgali]|uniref:MotA/TolQ/ExbB proton channel family protein n=1 Tax=Vreelandella jeotgali TaxID=553386 RepID=UPI001FDEF9A7|nr:MotA/TolQ/ExbB proton channel family protein [Halomonas jeotgali]